MKRLTLESLRALIELNPIDFLYDFLGYTYADEVQYQASPGMHARRSSFLSRFSWLREPDSEDLRRVFNQINSAYVDSYALQNPTENPDRFFSQCNALSLYRQGKPLGLRSREIFFGQRLELPFLDPLRNLEALRGISPEYLPTSMQLLCEAIDSVGRSRDAALFLSMSFITIHPYWDGTGRIARVMFTWLQKRWNFDLWWLKENEHGEAKCDGHGINSTFVLMNTFHREVCQFHNEVVSSDYSAPDPARSRMAFDSLMSVLGGIKERSLLPERFEPLINLRNHLMSYGHFVETCPRFEGLKDLIKGKD